MSTKLETPVEAPTTFKEEAIKFPRVTPLRDPNITMRALEWDGKGSVRIVNKNKPLITEPTDAIIRITTTTICGSDLHLYHNEFSGLHQGDILGHEFMGIVDDVGNEVQNLKKGDRVVVSAVITCGKCYYCKNNMFSCCDTTNPSKEMEQLYGHRTAGLFGYSHLTGGYDGGQAEFARVPLADNNCLKVPDNLPDEKVLMLSDVISTAYHATELGQVQAGQTVAIWGCGPVGLMAVKWAKFKGASRVIAIDGYDYRLEVAKQQGAETINFTEKDVVKTIHEICPNGPDVCIDCVGFRFPKSLLHKFQRALRLETDTPEVLHECIISCRKGGHISVIGDYYAFSNQFPIGAFMEKSLTMSGGQVFVQKYWKYILGLIEKGEFDPTFIITHVMPLEDAAKAYRMFDEKEDNAIKILLKPNLMSASF